MIENAEWTTEQELLLKNWGIRAKYFVLMHYNSCKYYRYLDNFLGAPSVVIDSIVTSITFGSLAFTNCETDFIFKLVSGNIMFISVSLAALHKYFKFGRTSVEHNESHYRYSSIIKDIEEELAIDRKNRVEPRIFMHKIKENFDSLLHSSPDIPRHIMKKYVEDLEKGERIKLTDKEILIRGKTPSLNNIPVHHEMENDSENQLIESPLKTNVENYIDIHKDIQSEFEQRLNMKKKQTLKDRIRTNNFI
jgi:hypothetical protein